MKNLILFLTIVFSASPLFSEEVNSSDLKQYKKRLKLLIKGQRKPGLKDFIEEMADVDHPKTVVLIPPAAISIPSDKNYRTARKAIKGLKNKESVKALASMLNKKKGDPRYKVLIADSFGRRKDKITLTQIITQLDSGIPQVQIAAINASAQRKRKEPVPALIDLLEKHWKLRDRIWLETREALYKLTGRDFETIEDWRKFWQAVGDTLNPKKVAKRKGKTGVKIDKLKDPVEFFGQEIFSRNLIFVIDTSGSMRLYDDSEDYHGKNLEKDRQRLRRARDQLVKALKKLSKGTRFNIIAYSDRVVTWQKQMKKASNGTIASAIKFVKGFKAQGFTHTDEALKEAFKDLGVDTIVLLSDGLPEKLRKNNQPTNVRKLMRKILGFVKDENASRKVRIDTFGFTGTGELPRKLRGGGRPPPPPPNAKAVQLLVDFLKEIAKRTGGSFRPID